MANAPLLPARWLEREWQRVSPWHLVLWPMSVFFGAIAAARRVIYRAGVLPVFRAPVPVVIIGNISVGGSGKTPLTLGLAGWMRELGWCPGIVSRGYGGSAKKPRLVGIGNSAEEVGDEALLLATRTGCPVYIARNRSAAAKALLKTHPECDLVLSDDGLQHYALARDFEIIVIDAKRSFGNGFLLPAGPLREPVARLATADAIVCHGACQAACQEQWPRRFQMKLTGDSFYNLLNPNLTVTAQALNGTGIYALAGIAHPERFFRHLEALGLKFEPRPFPDHHAFTRKDLEIKGAQTIIMTEKDAVKCQDFASENCWALAVQAEVEPDLALFIHAVLREQHGSQAA